MPTDPHTWDGDFLTATLLDGDLYQFAGSATIPTGVNFHVNRPIYKSYNKSTALVSVANGNWNLAYASSSAGGGAPESGVIVDSAGQFAGWFDPNLTGNVRYNSLAAGGGTPTSNGGLVLMTGYGLWPATGGGSNVGAGIGLSTASVPDSHGTLQATNAGHQTTCICIDLMDSNSQRWALFGFNGSGAALSMPLTTQADGSGWASRLHAHWASVYPANGFVNSNPPAPLGNWTPTSPALTTAFLNGTTGFRNPLRLLNMPPLARAVAGGSQALTANTAATITLTATSGMVTYGSFGSNTFTAPFTGLYFVHGYVACQNFSGNLRAGVKIGGVNYWGPYTPMPGTGEAGATKTQVFYLNAGDTVTLQGYATAAANTSTAHPARLVVTYLATGLTPSVGSPGSLPVESDTTFRFTAGTPSGAGQLAANFTSFPANDLNLLIHRPYAMAYQTVAQGIPVGTATALNLDTVKDIVHGNVTDNFSAWSSANSNYVAPISGWYLCVEEAFFAAPTLTATPSALALLQPNPNGADTWDRFQQQSFITTAASGATAVSYYYLRAGDTLTPGAQHYDTVASGNLNTNVSIANSHLEIVFLGQ